MRKSYLVERKWAIQPSPALVEMLEDLDDEQILVGPDRDTNDLEIDDIFIARFPTALQDLMKDADIKPDARGVLPQAVTTELNDFSSKLFHEGEILMEAEEDEIRIVAHDFGVLLLQRCSDPDKARIAGMFWGSTLVIDPIGGIMGLGYGRDLVMARLMKDEALPTWHHDTPGYSNSGAATIQSAARALLQMAHEISLQKDQDASDPGLEA